MAQQEKVYRITCEVRTSMLTTVLQVLDDAAAGVKVEAVTATRAKPRRHSYVGGRRDKGIHSQDLVLEELGKHAAVTEAHLRSVFECRGFSAKTVSPTVSSLVRQKRVRRGDGGTVSLLEE